MIAEIEDEEYLKTTIQDYVKAIEMTKDKSGQSKLREVLKTSLIHFQEKLIALQSRHDVSELIAKK